MRSTRSFRTRIEYGGSKEYLESDTATGTKFPSATFAANESKTSRTNTGFRDKRTFKVPAQIDLSERVFTGAHTKIATNDQIAPRMHFHDATAVTGKIYIGYIGKHLPNASTS